MARAVVDRILVALALVLGVHLPGDANTLTAALLVVMAVLDGLLRWRERAAVRELLEIIEVSGGENAVERIRGMLRRSGVFRRR